jgi:predicted acyltransferase
MDPQELWHVIPMIVGVAILATAAWIGSTDRGSKRLMTHKAVAGTGVVVILLGVAWLMVTKALEPDLTHFASGLVASAFVIVTPFGGLFALNAVPAKKAGMRRIHRLGAATVLGLSILTMILGMLDK